MHLLKAKVGYWEGRFTVHAYDEEKQPVTDLKASCPQGIEVVAIVKLDSVTFAGGKCGYSFRVHQVKPLVLQECRHAFIEDDDDEKPLKESDDEDTSSVKQEAQLVEDSDEEEEEEEVDEEVDELDVESEEEEENPPTPKKKVVRRRKKKASD